MNFFGFRPRQAQPTLIPLPDLEKALSQYCTPLPPDSKSSKRPCITDGAFQHIASLLEHFESHHGFQGWSRRPRTYTVLRNIGHLDLFQEFINLDLRDISFPYSREKLPRVLEDDLVCSKFMAAQQHVLTDAGQLENGPDARHALTKNGDDLYHVVRHLGRGGFGSVDLVWSQLSFRHYARKRFLRKKTLRETREDQTILREFEKELSNLKRLSHEHLVTVIGSYTDQRSVAFLMEPVADCNLFDYLCQPGSTINKLLPSLRSYFGCLANAVAYLHKQKIRHRDLKPQNVLIKQHQVFVADFGTALDWSKKERDTTADPNVPRTERYMSPEVGKGFPRNSASDMWSLGIVFLEMTTVLRGRTIADMGRYIESKGTKFPFVWGNPQATHEWFEVLRGANSGLESDNEPLTWIKDLTHRDPYKRPRAWELTKQIRDAASSYAFIGQCCAKDDESDYDQSPPMSANSGEFGNFDLRKELAALDLDEKPFGSFLEPSSQQAVEKWLDFNQNFEPNESSQYSSNEVPQFSTFTVPGSFPHELSEYEYTVQSISPETSEVNNLLNEGNIDEGVEYEIEEDSDEEETYSGGHEYDIAEDSSGSETTIRALPGAFPRVSQSLHNSTSGPQPAAGGDLISDNQSQDLSLIEICAQLDELDEDSTETVPKSTSRDFCAPTSNPVEMLTDSAPKALLNNPPNDFGKPPPTVPDVSETSRETVPKVPDISKTSSETLPKVLDIPQTSSETLPKVLSKNLPRILESGSQNSENASRLDASAPQNTLLREKKAKKSGLMGDEPQISPEKVPDISKTSSETLPRVLDIPQTSSETLPKVLLKDLPRILESGSQNSENASRLDASAPQNTLLREKKAKKSGLMGDEPQISPEKVPDISKTSSETLPRVLDIPQTSSETLPKVLSKDLPRIVESGSLSFKNVERLDASAPQKSLSKEKAEKTRKKTGLIGDEPRISPDVYMQEVWEAALTAETSIMSEKTKATINKFGSGLAWQDKSLNLLEYYVMKGSASAVRELLRVGCNAGTVKKPRYRPLMLAVKGGSQRHNKCVQALVKHGADVNARYPSSKKTALHCAIALANFPGYTSLIRDLLDAGADPNAKDSSGDFPLVQILYGGYEPLEKHKRDALACLLRSSFATDVNVRSLGTGNMPLHLAVRRKDALAVAMLIYRGALVNKPNGAGITPLKLAATGWNEKVSDNQIEVLRFLLSGGVNINETSGDQGFTALHTAAFCGCEGAVNLLLNKNADPWVKDTRGRTPCHVAGEAAEKMALETHSNIMNMLLKAQKVDYRTVGGQCAIVTAVKKNSVEDVEILLEHGFSANHRDKTSSNTPLLQLALNAHHRDMVYLIIDHGAFVDIKNDHGTDGLQCAAATRQLDLIDYLKVHGRRSR